jgi:hypothetical protein
MEEKDYTGQLFTSQSIISMLDEYYKEATPVHDPSPIVTWDHPTLVTNVLNTSDPAKLRTKHINHSAKVHILLADLKSLPANKLSVNTHYNELVSLSLYLRHYETSILTKEGMILCNDIYNWYESVKRTVK